MLKAATSDNAPFARELLHTEAGGTGSWHSTGTSHQCRNLSGHRDLKEHVETSSCWTWILCQRGPGEIMLSCASTADSRIDVFVVYKHTRNTTTPRRSEATSHWH